MVVASIAKEEIRVSVEKHFQGRAAEPQVPPLRYAPVGMTRGEGWRFQKTETVFHRLGWAKGP